jgi:spore germination cell wall hydrolase CwlJ-like protein
LQIIPAITVNLKNIDMKQVACMARNIYYEAGAEAMPGQAAIARVVLNRVNHGFAEYFL